MTFMKKIVSALALTLLLFFGWSPRSSAEVNDHQITICHATGADGHYSTPNPTKQQISTDGGHNSGGGVHPGDIIPPFAAGEHGGQSWSAFGGLNWDEVGQAIYNNGCVVPETEVTVVTVPETTTTVPETTTTTVAEATTTTTEATVVVSLDAAPPADTDAEAAAELARTGDRTDNMLMVAVGMAISGGALVYLSESYRKEYR